MCGKFTQMATWPEVHAFSQPLIARPEGEDVRVSTPMRMAKIMRLGEDGKRELVDMRWGFAKHGATAPSVEHMHARGETVDSKPRFCDSFGERRGVLLVDTFNEAEELPSGKRKQWVITPKDRKPIPIAVIWEEWESPEGMIPCFVMITVPPNPLVARITDRMPAILEQAGWPVWLGEVDAPYKDVKALLRTFDDQGNWEMAEQASSKKKPPPPTPPPQMNLF